MVKHFQHLVFRYWLEYINQLHQDTYMNVIYVYLQWMYMYINDMYYRYRGYTARAVHTE